MKRGIALIILLVSLFSSFIIGGFLGYEVSKQTINQVQVTVSEGNKPSNINLDLLWKVWGIIENKYVQRSTLDRQSMVYGLIEGLVNSLGDPYSVFMKPSESKLFNENLSGFFGGIGAEIGVKDGKITIISPMENSPAQKAGLLAGDVVIAIDKKDTIGMSLDDAIKLIRGERNTEVVLTIMRKGLDGAKDIKIIRDVVKIPNYKFEMKNGVGILELYNFNAEVEGDFKTIVQQLLDSKTKKLIIDLRNNPGGYLETAVSVASWILPKGELVAIEDFGNGKKDEYRSYGFKALENFKIVVIVNEGSASASEILAGALRDVKGIKLVGKKTFGKGSVQELQNLEDGSAIKITIAKWLTPKGISIQENGIDPDVEVDLTQEDVDNGKDPQLDKALELIKNL